MHAVKHTALILLVLGMPVATLRSSTPADAPEAKPEIPPPTFANVHYGEHERQVLDFWQAPSDTPTPVVIYLHGGAWMNGNKGGMGRRDLRKLLDAGISVVAISYRYVSQAQEAGVKPPVSWPMSDTARAIQFVRSKAAEWNIDKSRVAGAGGSAGACSILWTALHDDMAEPSSSDPIARESTRLCCVALDGVQSTLDPGQMREWIPNSRYGAHAFGLPSPKERGKNEKVFEEFLRRRDEFLPWIREYSPIEHASAGDPPVYLWFKEPPAMGQPQKDPTHSANFGVGLKDKLEPLGIECQIYYPGSSDTEHNDLEPYLTSKLKPAPTAPAKKPANPPPTFANVPYGDHERQVLDFWKAPSDKPTPVLYYIHGGGWVKFDKSEVPHVAKFLAAGISVASINYRYSTQAQEAGIKPPLQWPLEDAARALQFVRSKAAEWNIDKQRIGAAGTSAGACSALWLALHDDIANPQSNDPVARESTRLYCAAVTSAQTSLDPKEMREWTPNMDYGGHAFGFWDPKNPKSRDKHFDEFLAHREEFLPWIRKYSPYGHASTDDPPIYLFYGNEPAIGQPRKDPKHNANFGVKLKEKLDSLGVSCELVYPGAPDIRHKDADSYLIEKLKP